MRSDPVKEEAEKAGLKVSKSEAERLAESNPYRPAILDWKPTSKRHPWWYAYACARIARILEGAKPARGHSVESACASAAHPKLAHRFTETFFYFQTRSRPAPTKGGDHNPFRGMSDSDAYARWYEIIERICDASTGKMGTWRVGLSVTGAARNKG